MFDLGFPKRFESDEELSRDKRSVSMNEQLAMVVYDRSRFVLSNTKSREKSLEVYYYAF